MSGAAVVSGWRQRDRGLAEGVAPALGRADVSVAEPQAPVERLAVPVRAFEPEASRDDRGVFAVEPHGLGAFVLDLLLVDDVLVAGGAEQVFARIDRAGADHED